MKAILSAWAVLGLLVLFAAPRAHAGDLDLTASDSEFKALRASLRAHLDKSDRGIRDWVRENGAALQRLPQEQLDQLVGEAGTVGTKAASRSCIETPCDNGVLGGLDCVFSGCFKGCLKDYPVAGFGRCRD
jgi:hypothetical protein